MNKNTLLWAVVIIILLIIVGYGGYLIGSQRKITVPIIILTPTPLPSTATPTPTITPTPALSPVPQMTPSEVVQGFFASYEICLKNPPQAATGQVSAYCQSHNPFISSTFVTNLAHGGVAQKGADPVVCAQNLPQSFTMGTTTINDNVATVKVFESFGTSTVEVSVSLLKGSNGWRVDNITCPSPS